MKKANERITALIAATTIIPCRWSFFEGTTVEPGISEGIVGDTSGEPKK
jgi:hypothetical protein